MKTLSYRLLLIAISIGILATAGAQTGGKKKSASKPVKPTAKAAAAKPQPDPKAEALLNEVVAASKAVDSLTADLVMSDSKAGQSARGKIKLKRPNLIRLEIVPDKADEGGMALISDGSTMWNVMRKKGEEQYMSFPSNEQALKGMMAALAPVSAYLGDIRTGPAGDKRTARYLGPKDVGGASYEVVRLTDKFLTTDIYVGADKLIHRAVMGPSAAGPGQSGTISLDNLNASAALTAADFAYTPPATAKKMDMPGATDYDKKLVAVGRDAPRFTLATPTGGQIALEDTLKGKKAVLVNFWFYN